MNYSALIQNRKSVREFQDREVSFSDLQTLRNYYQNSVRSLLPQLKTELYFFGISARTALEGSAGYHNFLVGSPQYLVLMSEKAPQAGLNAGFIMEDLILKANDLGLDACWVTFHSSEDVKNALGIDSELDVAAIAAFGYGKKTTKRLRLNILSMSNVDIVAKHRYMEPKRSIQDLAYLNSWGNTHGLDAYIGFFDDTLWEALHAASLAPSYLNRQAYGFLLHSGTVTLVQRPDAYTTEIDGDLSLGIVLHHFTTVAEERAGKLTWKFGEAAGNPVLPEGHKTVASCAM